MNQKNLQLFIERTNLRVVITIILIAVLGICLLYVATYLNFYPGWQVLVRDIGGLLFISVVITIVWELFAKRAFAEELMEKAKIAEDVRSAGLRQITFDFHHDVDWQNLFKKAKELDIFFSYGRSWRNTHTTQLKEMAKNQTAKIRLVLPDPDNKVVISELALRFNENNSEVRSRINEAKDEFIDIFTDQNSNAEFSIWFLKQSPLYSFYRFDHIIIMALYKHKRGRGNVPAFASEIGGTLYNFVREEFESMISDNTLTRQVYPELSEKESNHD